MMADYGIIYTRMYIFMYICMYVVQNDTPLWTRKLKITNNSIKVNYRVSRMDAKP